MKSAATPWTSVPITPEAMDTIHRAYPSYFRISPPDQKDEIEAFCLTYPNVRMADVAGNHGISCKMLGKILRESGIPPVIRGRTRYLTRSQVNQIQDFL